MNRRRRSPRLIAAIACVFLLMGPSATAPFAQEADLSKELPRIPPREVRDALKSFRIHEGFRLEPIAVEPQVTDPVSVSFDADGKLYVAEMRGYPYPENTPTGNVTLLEDRDDDGRFETSSRFVDRLSWPTSVLSCNGGVLIAVAPDILFAKDTDEDGVADVKTVLFTGFGTQNVQALVNGLLFGPDGWVYGVSGGNGGDIRNPGRPGDRAVSVRGRDFRFRPDGSKFEAISGGGQFGHAFDDWGHRFTCNNSNHLRQVVLPSRDLERNPALLTAAVIDDIAAEGPAAPVYRISPAEPWRVVRTRQRAADPAMARRLPPTELVATGFFTSATGVTIYRGSTYPDDYRGNAFIGDVGGNLVHRKRLAVHGAEFLGTRADPKVEFLASEDNWFRPVNFTNTPAGTLLILDMYRETIEHPFSIPEPIKKHLDLTSGKDRGRLYELVSTHATRPRATPRLSAASTATLVGMLAHPDAWWRESAQRLLLERRDFGAVAPLKALARSRPSPLGRMHALWTLDALDRLDPELLNLGLKDEEPRVREASASLATTHLEKAHDVATALLALAEDPDSMVRFQAALSIGDLKGPRAVEALAALAARDGGDRWFRSAILSGLSRRCLPFLEALSTRPGFLESAEGQSWVEQVAELIGSENDPGQVDSLLARFAGPDGAGGGRSFSRVLLGVGRGLSRSGGSLRAILKRPGSRSLDSLFKEAAAVAAGDGPVSARENAIRLIGLGPESVAIEVLGGLLDARQPNSVQLVALQSLGALTDPRVGSSVLLHWKSLSPTVRREAIEILFARRERLVTLLDAIEAKTVAPSDIDPARKKQLLASLDRSVRERAHALIGTEVRSDRGSLIADYRPALQLQGERERGRAVFKKACATCHKAEGQGIDVGPNLVTITGRTPDDLLIHILDPNREVAPAYLNYQLATTDGRVVSGLIAEESANAVTLKRAEGVAEVVPRDRIEAIASTGLSLMPEGLEKGVSHQDMADLIAFLRSLQAAPTAAPPR